MVMSSSEVVAGGVVEGYDVCVVGAGAAGLPLACRLAGTALKVLVLVAGTPEEKGLPPSFRQKVYGGEVGGFLGLVDPLFLRRSRLHMFGGTTNHFGFWSRPLDPEDFTPRPGYRDAAWPFQRGELEPYYREAMEWGRYGPFAFEDLPYWERLLSGHPFGDDGSLRPAVFHAQYEERYHDFQLRAAQVLSGAANVTLLFNTSVLTVESTPGNDHVTGLTCASIVAGAAGHRFQVRSGRYVLAQGGIESVRTLLLSGGLGNNARDHLGRGFMVHPLLTTAARVTFARPVAAEVRNWFRDQQVRLRREGDSYVHDTAPLVDPRLLFQHRVFNAWGVLTPSPEAMRRERIGNFRAIVRFNEAGDAAELNLNWEQVPNEESRITLGAGTDPVFGQRVVHLDWRLRGEDKRTVVTALDLCEAHLRRHGATAFTPTSDLSGGPEHWTFGRTEAALATGDHHMGALRMGATAAEGVVDADSRFHGVDNLYTAGCAQFPTSGYANPTLTIVALSLRLADRLNGL